MNPIVKNVLVIAVRQAWPYIGGAAAASDSEVQQIVGALMLLGGIAYHAWQRHRGKKAPAIEGE